MDSLSGTGPCGVVPSRCLPRMTPGTLGSSWPVVVPERPVPRPSGSGRRHAIPQGPRFLLVARTAADVREVLVEGELGILAWQVPSSPGLNSRPSIRRLIWPTGNMAFCTSADEPDSLRGVQAHYSRGDEVAAWRLISDLRRYDRLGQPPCCHPDWAGTCRS